MLQHAGATRWTLFDAPIFMVVRPFEIRSNHNWNVEKFSVDFQFAGMIKSCQRVDECEANDSHKAFILSPSSLSGII
jgi:hypothetical protein